MLCFLVAHARLFSSSLVSGLMRTFAESMLHAFGVRRRTPPKYPPYRSVCIFRFFVYLILISSLFASLILLSVSRTSLTFSSRSGVRKTLNERDLFDAIKNITDITPRFVDLAKISLTQQFELLANTDIYVGLHGAGMIHTLFLPEVGCIRVLLVSCSSSLSLVSFGFLLSSSPSRFSVSAFCGV
jgi:hypothetical protein